MSGNEHFRDDSADPELEPERAEQLLDEASRTVSGLPKDLDPRYIQTLSEEQERLRKIADSLIPPVE